MYALAINNEGIVHAANVERKGGRIFLRAGGDVRNSGELNASGGEEENGGEIIVTGKTVDIAGEVNASGENGGAVSIGGGKQGNDAGIKNSENTWIRDTAMITASGGSGDGGTVVVWADEATLFEGTITATGGEMAASSRSPVRKH
jgi:hypothetical protein